MTINCLPALILSQATTSLSIWQVFQVFVSSTSSMNIIWCTILEACLHTHYHPKSIRSSLMAQAWQATSYLINDCCCTIWILLSIAVARGSNLHLSYNFSLPSIYHPFTMSPWVDINWKWRVDPSNIKFRHRISPTSSPTLPTLSALLPFAFTASPLHLRTQHHIPFPLTLEMYTFVGGNRRGEEERVSLRAIKPWRAASFVMPAINQVEHRVAVPM